MTLVRNLLVVLALLLALSSSVFANVPQREIEEMCAPIALYPDTLIANVLAAATYPDQVEQAAEYARSVGHIDPNQLEEALTGQGWDAAVKALVAFPDVLYMMDSNRDWVAQLGNTFLTQSQDVFSAIQTLRTKAKLAGNLESSAEVEVSQNDSYVVLAPVSPEIVYVPLYDPAILYYWAPRPWYLGWGAPVFIGSNLCFGVCNWSCSNLYFGRGYNYYYCSNVQNVTYNMVQTRIASGTGAWPRLTALRAPRLVPQASGYRPPGFIPAASGGNRPIYMSPTRHASNAPAARPPIVHTYAAPVNRTPSHPPAPSHSTSSPSKKSEHPRH